MFQAAIQPRPLVWRYFDSGVETEKYYWNKKAVKTISKEVHFSPLSSTAVLGQNCLKRQTAMA